MPGTGCVCGTGASTGESGLRSPCPRRSERIAAERARVHVLMTSVKSVRAPSVVLFVALVVLPLQQQEGVPLTAPFQPPQGGTEPADEPPFGTAAASPPEIKVVTFNQGRFDPRILEPVRFWPRGHTAVIIDGAVHSFETDWQCGETEAEYKRANEWRGAWVQVLDLPASDAKQIRKDFARSCGTGAFLLTGVCTSSAGRLLQNALPDLTVTWAPMRLRAQLGRRGYVDRTYRWHREVWADHFVRCLRGENGDPPPLKGPHLSKGMARKARGKCLKQLGLRTEDVSLPVESSADPARSSPPKPSLHNRGTPNQSRHAAPTKSSASPKRSRANGGGTHSRSLDGAQEPPRKREWETKPGHRSHSVNTETSGPGRRALSVRSVHVHNHEPAGQQGPGPVSIFTVPVPPVGLPSASIFRHSGDATARVVDSVTDVP